MVSNAVGAFSVRFQLRPISLIIVQMKRHHSDCSYCAVEINGATDDCIKRATLERFIIPVLRDWKVTAEKYRADNVALIVET